LKPTRASLVVLAMLAAAALVPTAQALSGKKAPRRATAKGPQAQLNQTRGTLARAAVQLARVRRASGRGALHQQVLQLQTTLDQARSQLHTAQLALRGPSPLEIAVQQVKHEVAYAQGVGYSKGQLTAEAAMDYVAGHVSDTEYGYLETSHKAVPPPSANRTLVAQAGICTGAAVTLGEIVHRLGYKVRSVNFYYDDLPPNVVPDGHVAVEVQYDGGWHFFDPTYGLFWTDASGNVLSVAQVRAGEGTLQKNVAAFTNVFEDAVFGNDAWFITDPKTTLAYYATKLVNVK
jgi:hypothetical protein